MANVLISCFVGAFLAPVIHKKAPYWSGVLLALIPLSIFIGVSSGVISSANLEPSSSIFSLMASQGYLFY